nr:hypothetical protein [Providencia rettgeri]
MREVKPTQKPVPSSDIKDLFFNSGLLDIWTTSLEHKYIDRFGNCHLTSAGMEWIFNELVTKFKIESEQALLAAGYAPAGTFQEGAEVVSRNGTVLWKLPDGDGDHYRWDGDLPKQVPAGSTPQSTGGIGKGAWVSVGDASLRGDLNKNSGASMIGTTTGENVEERLGNVEEVASVAKKGRNPRYLKIRHVISHEQQRIQPVIDRYNYTFFGQQGLYVDTIDNKLYITYQSISDTNKWVWVVVFDWVTGDYLYRFSTDSDGAPEGIAIIHDGNSRYMLLPEYQNSRTFRYSLPAVIAEDTHLIHDAEFSTGSKYQLGNYKNRIAISRDIGGANHGFDYDGNRVDIYSTSGFVSGTLTKYSSLSLDNALQGRAGEKPKRQGLTMGQNSILASVGAYTPTSGYKPSGLYGYLEYNLDGSLKNNAIFSPAEFADKLVAAGYERLKTIENESICLADENENAEIFTCAIGAMGDKTDSQRSVIIIQHNCLGGDDVIDMSSSAGANVNFYNDLPSSYHTLNNDNPLSGALFTKVSDICEFMITYDVSNYTLMTTSEITLDTSARVKIGIGSLLTVTSINKDIFKVEWSGKVQNIGVTTSSVGNLFIRKSENYEITNLSFNLLQNSPMPPFAGDVSYSVVGCPLFSPVGGGNGVLMESGYAWNRTFQRFIDVAGNLYIRYADEATRNTTTGWKKFTGVSI